MHPDHAAHGERGDNAHGNHTTGDFKKRFWVALAASVPVLALSPSIQSFFGITLAIPHSPEIAFFVATFVYIYGGAPFLRGSLRELKKGQPGMMTLVAVAVTAAFVYSGASVFGLTGNGKELLWELVTLIDIMLLGHWIEMKSVLGASRALEELAGLLPKMAHKREGDGSVSDVFIALLTIGNEVVVKPGERIPVDGVVVEGMTSVDESMLTGESGLVLKQNGSRVIAGALNAESAIVVQVTKTGKDTYLSRIVTLVREAQGSKSRTQDVANKAALWLTIVALGGGTLTLFAWLLFSQPFGFAIERAIAVIVIACPHALGLAIPLVVAFSTALSAQRGLLIRDRTAFEAARNVDTIVFDKTGTLTKGTFVVSEVIPLDAVSSDDVLINAGSIDAGSSHPIAKAIVEAAPETRPVLHASVMPGRGFQGTLDGALVQVVSEAYVRERGVSYDEGRVREALALGKTAVFVLREGKPMGVITLDDAIRDEAREAVNTLKEKGYRVVMITGDNESVGKRVAGELHLDEYFAGVLPHKKAEIIVRLQEEGRTVAMVGDGVNDAPALAQADIGIAIGAGTDVAIETASIILVRNNPLDVVHVMELSRQTYRKMIQNLWWAAGYNIIALPLAAGVLYGSGIVLSPAIGAVLMSLSTVIVAFNASLLRNAV
ncbi:MAG: copper-translocating P-type ATPase [Parcubacteria group bacterium]|nr:copper-translocating P-type ATPase [Parcubacteria group bacterium]